LGFILIKTKTCSGFKTFYIIQTIFVPNSYHKSTNDRYRLINNYLITLYKKEYNPLLNGKDMIFTSQVIFGLEGKFLITEHSKSFIYIDIIKIKR